MISTLSGVLNVITCSVKKSQWGKASENLCFRRSLGVSSEVTKLSIQRGWLHKEAGL